MERALHKPPPTISLEQGLSRQRPYPHSLTLFDPPGAIRAGGSHATQPYWLPSRRPLPPRPQTPSFPPVRRHIVYRIDHLACSLFIQSRGCSVCAMVARGSAEGWSRARLWHGSATRLRLSWSAFLSVSWTPSFADLSDPPTVAPPLRRGRGEQQVDGHGDGFHKRVTPDNAAETRGSLRSHRTERTRRPRGDGGPAAESQLGTRPVSRTPHYPSKQPRSPATLPRKNKKTKKHDMPRTTVVKAPNIPLTKRFV